MKKVKKKLLNICNANVKYIADMKKGHGKSLFGH